MSKYADANKAVQNYAAFGNRWEKVRRDFDAFCEHLDNLEGAGVKGITITRDENKQHLDINAYGRKFGVQLLPQVTGESIRGYAIFFELLLDNSTRTVKKFVLDGGGFISDPDQTNSLPAYDASSLQLKYWINLIDLALTPEPILDKNNNP